MSNGATESPLTIFLAKLIAEYGPSKIEFIRSLGRKDVERGLQRLNSLESGEGSKRLVTHIAAVYPAHAEELHKAIEETAWSGKLDLHESAAFSSLAPCWDNGFCQPRKFSTHSGL